MKFRGFLSAFALFFLIASHAALAQVSVPDYQNWGEPFDRFTVNALHNKKEVSLKNPRYMRSDDQMVSVLHNENDNPWLLVYKYVGHTPDHQNESLYYHLFEYVDNRWTHVRDLSKSPDPDNDLVELLNTRYGLFLSAH